MDIREATEEDIPDIVTLLKISLGETLMPKSAEYWRWKHINNPFGQSPVLLCYENSTLVGVRAFMRWEWSSQAQVYRAVRAVDTATHPDHQGKGIFKKLTLALVENCKKSGDHFVFNTPNEKSKPGYLKMGWKEAGRLPVVFIIRRPVNMVLNFIGKARFDAYNDGSINHFLEHPAVDSLLRRHYERVGTLVTHASGSYLRWRYLDVPVSQYLAIGEEQGNNLKGLLIARIKKSRVGVELRVTDLFFEDKSIANELMKKLRQKRKEWNVDFMTLAGTSKDASENSGFSFKASVGPSVTIRSLAMSDMHELENFNNWSPSLGDLELF